jgi:2-polyprenyl-3-methyl-5-hydroxy-6-metoxy-1,4-benzoquinol methylase
LKNNKYYSWRKIWNNRDINFLNKFSTLEKLMLLNGHLKSVNKISVKSWINYGKQIQKKIRINRNESIFEFGAGSGALLYLFKQKTNKLHGCDFSTQLVNKSKSLFKKSKIIHQDCGKISTKKKFDHIITSSMLEYAKPSDIENIILKMISKFKKTLFIGEVLDEERKYAFLKKFKKKNYNFINKKTFLNLAKGKNLNIEFIPSILPKSKQKLYRYCVLITKN